MIAKIILLCVLGYLVGSIPWGLLVGKLFFDTDIREYGSHNLGGTNAARVLGLPYGILVIFLDAFKSLIVMTIVHKIYPGIEQYVGLCVCIGHCFPIFAKFKGGKAVSSAYGYLLGLSIYVTEEYLLTFISPILFFFIVLFSFKMVSLASMTSILFSSIVLYIFSDKQIALLIFILAIFIIYRHSANIKRIIDGKEAKIKI